MVTKNKIISIFQFFLFSLLLVHLPAHASSLDINAHSNAIRITYAQYVQSQIVTDYGILLLDKNNKNKDDEVALHVGLGKDFDNIRFGGRVFYISPGDVDLLAIGFGLQAKTHLSKSVSLLGHFYYAPEFTSLLDSEGYSEFAARLNFKLSKKAYVYFGYRTIKVSIQDTKGDVELDDDLHIGIKLFF